MRRHGIARRRSARGTRILGQSPTSHSISGSDICTILVVGVHRSGPALPAPASPADAGSAGEGNVYGSGSGCTIAYDRTLCLGLQDESQ